MRPSCLLLARLVLPASLALGVAVLSHADLPNEAPKDRPYALTSADAALPGDAAGAAVVQSGQKKYWVWHIEFINEGLAKDFAIEGSHVLGRRSRFVDVLFPLNNENRIEPAVWDRLVKAKGIYAFDRENVITPPEPPIVRKDLGTKSRGSEKVVRGGVGTLNGENVLIAILDTGLDFRHPDFIDDGGSSRLLYLWDTTRTHDPRGKGKAAPVTYPDGQSIGTIYSREDLTEDLRSGKQPLGPTDTGGHGTGCAGVAAGNGRGDKKQIGVAPKATLIGVRIHGERADNSYLLNAIGEWLDKTARTADRPLVISCSWSAQKGGRDSTFVTERCLSSIFRDATPGRFVCFSAGNQGTSKIHARVQFEDAKSPALLTWKASLEERMTVCIDGITPEQIAVKPTGNTKLRNVGITRNLVSGTTFVDVDVLPGEGGLELSAKVKPKTPLIADAYFPKFPHKKPTYFTCEGVVNALQLGSPGTALSSINVGSYDFNDEFHPRGNDKPITIPGFDPINPDKLGPALILGTISDYSNAGYLRQTEHLGHGVEVIKPDLAAPGRCFTAPAAEHAKEQWRSSDPRYQYFDGTSAATPYTAGVIALLLQRKPGLTPAEFRKLLGDGGLTKDKFTGDLPNTLWGRGKLDYDAVERLIKRLN